MIHLVTIERIPTRPIPEFVKAIRANSTSFWKVMSNVWLVETDTSARALAKLLRPHLGAGDRLLVIRTQAEYGGWASRDTWKWLRVSRDAGDFD